MVDQASVSCADLQDWSTEFESLAGRVASLFAHPKSQAHSRQYLEGLLAPIERKNGWTANGLTGPLLTANPNGANPRRLDPATIGDVLTCDQDHNYTDEQKAFDNGKMDRFPQTVGAGSGKSPGGTTCAAPDVMNYYDGNTVTASGTTPSATR